MPVTRVFRGQVVAASIYAMYDVEKYFIVVSHNHRNEKHPTFLALKLTTTPPKFDLDTNVLIPRNPSGLSGWIECEYIYEISPKEVDRILTSFNPFINKIDEALKIVFGLY